MPTIAYFRVVRSTILKFGLAAGFLLVALKVSEYTFLNVHLDREIYFAIVAALFLAAGIFVGVKMRRKQVVEVEVEVPVPVAETSFSGPDQNTLADLGISKREMDVLQGISEGLSNQEIADALFVSLSTIKTHTNNLYSKLDVKRRTQALSRAKDLNLIP